MHTKAGADRSPMSWYEGNNMFTAARFIILKFNFDKKRHECDKSRRRENIVYAPIFITY
jgi:hypothetical protein